MTIRDEDRPRRFWLGVSFLTILDLTLFAWQAWGPTTDQTRDDLRTVELLISTLFVGELVLRCYAHDREQLSQPANVLDTAIILSAFFLSLVDVYTPLLAARAARLIRFGATTTRCGRAARNTTRSAVEMRSFFDRAGKGLAARVAMRATESDIAPLFVDVSKSRELDAVFAGRPWQSSRRTREDSTLIDAPILASASSIKRLAKTEIENAEAFEMSHRANARKNNSPSRNNSMDLREDADLEAAEPVVQKRTLTSSRALVAVLEHAIADAKDKGKPPPRLINCLRAEVDLVFLKEKI